MFGILFLTLSIGIGFVLVKAFLPDFFVEGQAPEFMLVLPAAYTVGVIASGIMTYALCLFFSPTGYGMLFGSASVIPILSAFFVLTWKRTIGNGSKMGRAGLWKAVKNSFRRHAFLYCFFVLLAIFLCWFFFYCFFYSDGRIAAGYSVFSDFGPHVALIRSFSRGNNFPAQYPHFPDGTMRYHFMFQFYVGILEFLGLRIDLALNIMSLLALLSCLSLLYILTVKLVKKPAAGIIAIILFLFRSSFAIFTYLFDGTRYASIAEIIDKILNTRVFIGNTPNEVWGLWTLNVYANQRHFALGLSLMLVTIIAFLPLYKGMRFTMRIKATKREDDKEIAVEEEREYNWLAAFFKGSTWRPGNYPRAVFLGLLIGAATYFHGSCVTATLGILAIMAIFSEAKLSYVIAAGIALALSVMQNQYFSAGAPMVSPRFQFGFIVANPSVLSVAAYLIELTGVLFAVVFAGAALRWKKLGGLFLAFLLPAVLTFTLSMSTDITVNHKFLMISVSLLNIFAAYAIVRMTVFFMGRKTKILKVAGNIIAGLLILLLTGSGAVDTAAFINQNGPGLSAMYADQTSDTVKWIGENTAGGSVFLSSWHVQSPVMLAGRFEFMGWPYFGWSAGYDTYGRGDVMRAIFAAESPDELRVLARDNGISYVYVEPELMNSGEFSFNEDMVAAAFPLVFSSDDKITRIYKVE